MAYSFNGNDLNSCIELCERLYSVMFNKEGQFNSFGGTNGEVGNDYIGATKDDFYYYRGYAVGETNPGAVNKYHIYGSDYRTPFNVNDNIIRPFFALKHNIDQSPEFEWALSFYIGCKYKSGGYNDWNFNTNRYGTANNNYDVDLFSNTSYPLRCAYLEISLNGELSSA